MDTARQLVRRLTYAWLIAAPLLLITACAGSDEVSPTTQPTANDASATAVTSFRYELTIQLSNVLIPFYFEQRGEVVLPDREHAVQSWEQGLLSLESDRVAIGDRVWLKGDLPWLDLGASPLGAIGSGTAAAAAFRGWSGSVEQLDGQSTTRYTLTRDELVRLMGTPPGDIDESTSGSIWISNEYGIPVRMVLEATGEPRGDGPSELRLELRVLDINATDIAVEEPPTAQTANLGGVVR